MTNEQILEAIDGMDADRLAELRDAFIARFNVVVPSFSSVIEPAAPAPTVAVQTEFTVELTASGPNKINVIKLVREVSGLALKEAKDAVDKLPSIVGKDLPEADANALAARFSQVGAVVSIK